MPGACPQGNHDLPALRCLIHYNCFATYLCLHMVVTRALSTDSESCGAYTSCLVLRCGSHRPSVVCILTVQSFEHDGFFGPRLTQAALSAIAALPKLKRLKLRGGPFGSPYGQVSVQSLMDMLRACPTLVWVELQSFVAVDHWMEETAQVLNRFTWVHIDVFVLVYNGCARC